MGSLVLITTLTTIPTIMMCSATTKIKLPGGDLVGRLPPHPGERARRRGDRQQQGEQGLERMLALL